MALRDSTVLSSALVLTDQSPSTSQPLRYLRRTKWLASSLFVNFRLAASQSSDVLGNRVARQPSRTDSVSGPE